ncbi:MAG: aminofutalosine synthase MqnE, partial [Thermoguttaceae bacterium]
AERFGMTYRQVLEQLVDAGLGSLPGGGAEIFADRVRRKICKDKATADQWLEVHRVAHGLGLKSNCTMLYGTIERPDEIVDHLLRLRSLQDETGGFQAFIPLAYHRENNRLGKLPEPSGAEGLRMIAASRLLLDNIAHVKAYWVMLGLETAGLAQTFGADDMDGTVVEEKIYHMAGATTPEALTVAQLRGLIEATGRRPVERTTTYDLVGVSR